MIDLVELDRILNEAKGVSVDANYVDQTGKPYGNNPHSSWLWLGTYTSTKGNRNIGAINLTEVRKRFGEAGVDALRKNLISILAITPPDQTGIPLPEDKNYKPRPLKSTTTVRGRYDTIRYDIPELANIGKTCYETPSIHKMSDVEIGEFLGITEEEAKKLTEEEKERKMAEKVEEITKKPVAEQKAEIEEELDQISREIKQHGPVKPEVPVATPEKPISEPPEEKPEIPPEELEPAKKISPEEGAPEIPIKPEEKPPEASEEEEKVAEKAAKELVNTNIDIKDEGPIGSRIKAGEPITPKPKTIPGVNTIGIKKAPPKAVEPKIPPNVPPQPKAPPKAPPESEEELFEL